LFPRHKKQEREREIFRKNKREIFLTKPYTLKNRRAKKKKLEEKPLQRKETRTVPSQTGRRATAAAAAALKKEW
jgi:hypothetical protein